MEKGGVEGRVWMKREEEAAVGAEGLVTNEGGYNMFPHPCWCRGRGMEGTMYRTEIGNGNELRRGTE